MSKTIKAVTVTKDYLNCKIWVVKTLAVFDRKDGTPYWYVTQIIDSCPVRHVMFIRAMDYGREKDIPYFDNVKHGQDLTVLQIEVLRRYSLCR